MIIKNNIGSSKDWLRDYFFIISIDFWTNENIAILKRII